MKLDLNHMILNLAGRDHFEGLVALDSGAELGAAESLHALIMDYARVAQGGESELGVVVPQRLRTPAQAAKPEASA